MMNALQISPTWKAYYNYPTKARLGAINAMMPVGKIFGFSFVAPFSNHYGRKTSLVLAFIIAVIGAGIQAGSVNFGVLVFSRWLLGFGCGVMSQPSPILLAELSYPTHRGRVTALYHCFYVSVTVNSRTQKASANHLTSLSDQLRPLGSRLVHSKWLETGAGASRPCSKGQLHWDSSSSRGAYRSRLGNDPFLIFSSERSFEFWADDVRLVLRYLIAKGRIEEARDLLTKHHAAGIQDSMLVQYEMLQIQEALRAEAASEQTKMRHVLRFPANRRRLFIAAALGIAAQWSGNAVVSYYLTLVLDGVGITNPTHQSLINGGLQIFNLFATVSCGAMLVDKLGRRFLFLWSAMGMAVASTVCKTPLLVASMVKHRVVIEIDRFTKFGASC